MVSIGQGTTTVGSSACRQPAQLAPIAAAPVVAAPVENRPAAAALAAK